MLPSRIGWAVILLASICVLLIFFLPASFGPFSAVHGPVTALRCRKAAALIFLAMSLCRLFASIWSSRLALFGTSFEITRSSAGAPRSGFDLRQAELRC